MNRLTQFQESFNLAQLSITKDVTDWYPPSSNLILSEVNKGNSLSSNVCRVAGNVSFSTGAPFAKETVAKLLFDAFNSLKYFNSLKPPILVKLL